MMWQDRPCNIGRTALVAATSGKRRSRRFIWQSARPARADVARPPRLCKVGRALRASRAPYRTSTTTSKNRIATFSADTPLNYSAFNL